jgi:chaperonin GroES
MKAKKKNKKTSSGAAKKAPAVSGPRILPIGDRVLVKISAEVETTTASGIIIPDTGNGKKSGRGKVVAVGQGRMTDDGKRIPVQVKIGDTVLFSEYAGERVEFDGEEYYLVSEGNIQAIINK